MSLSECYVYVLAIVVDDGLRFNWPSLPHRARADLGSLLSGPWQIGLLTVRTLNWCWFHSGQKTYHDIGSLISISVLDYFSGIPAVWLTGYTCARVR